jgi:hypothetical protein
MKHEFEIVIEGLLKYINNNIYPGMNELQEFAARVVVGRLTSNTESLKEIITNNGFIRTFGFVDEDGMVDVESVATDIKREIERQEKISFTIPMLGRYTFKPCDVDVLYRTITGKELANADATNQEVY